MARTIEIRRDNTQPGEVCHNSWTPNQRAWFDAHNERSHAIRMAHVGAVTSLGDIRADNLLASGFFEEGMDPVSVWYANRCREAGIEPRELTAEEREPLEEMFPYLFR